MLRLLVVTPGRIASTQIFDLVFQGLADQGAIEVRTVFDNESTAAEQQEAVLEADVVFFLRSFTQSSLALLRYARHHGRLVVYSTDDDFRELDPDTPLGRLHLEPQTLEAYESLVAEADLVWLYTPEMRRRYQGLARRITIGRLPSFVEINAPRSAAAIDPPGEEPTLVIGYGGSSTHESDLRVVVRPLLAALDRWDHVRAQFINYAPAELARHPRVEVRPFMGNLLSYYEFLRQARWSIGLAPLRDDRFNRGKTSNKYREYAGLGIPGIYSNVPVYAEDVRHLETGWLADHDEDSFAGALRAMIEDPALRRRIRIGSLQDASSRFSLRAMQMHFLREISRLALELRHLSWRRPRLLAVGYERTSSMQIGALQPLRRLQREGLVELRHVEPESATPEALEGADAVLVLRAFEEVTLPLLDAAHAKDTPLVASWDDDFLSIPSGTPIGDFYNHPSVVRAIRRYLSESSLVLASTPPLFARSAEHNDRVMESIYGLDEESVPPADAAPPGLGPATRDPGSADAAASSGAQPLRIGFYGSNDALALPWMVEALRLLRARHGRAIEIEAIGIDPGRELADLLDWVEPGVRGYAESLASLRSRGWAIGLAPLADSAFNSAKQATKFRDYAWAGVATVCSRVPAYERVLLDGVHARFADESPEDWAAIVSHLVEHADERARLVRGALSLLEHVHVQSLTDASWLQLLWRMGASREVARAPLKGSVITFIIPKVLPETREKQ
ncbi:MAG: glycosyltransferase [Alphaproteobacteria bacterium]